MLFFSPQHTKNLLLENVTSTPKPELTLRITPFTYLGVIDGVQTATPILLVKGCVCTTDGR